MKYFRNCGFIALKPSTYKIVCMSHRLQWRSIR